MNTSSGTLKMICFIKNYKAWDSTLHAYAKEFFDEHMVYPNIACASHATWNHIDKIANKRNPKNIQRSEDYLPDHTIGAVEEEEEIKTISGFATAEYSIDFCVDELIGNNCVVLIFDEDPTFDGENIEGKNVYRRVA